MILQLFLNTIPFFFNSQRVSFIDFFSWYLHKIKQTNDFFLFLIKSKGLHLFKMIRFNILDKLFKATSPIEQRRFCQFLLPLHSFS